MGGITARIEQLLDFGILHKTLDEADRSYTRNLLLDAMRMDAPEEEEDGGTSEPIPPTLAPILDALCSYAAARGLIEGTQDEKERFGARLAGFMTPHPERVRRDFWRLYKLRGAEAATDWFYQLCRACDYIRVDQIARNRRFSEDSRYGELEITINLSKPEKDPRDIIAQRNAPQVGYPRCMLCAENSGYAGRAGYPARQNHRMVPVALGNRLWHMQYSPYLYYEEHCIVLNDRHIPMRVNAENLGNMFDFVDQFPHYFIGSNADLPIVGGSILSHDHFQGGRHTFPMDRAPALVRLSAPVPNARAEVVRWPMSCVRLRGTDRSALLRLADEMLCAWRGYSDESLGILAETDTPHNTVTPVLRREGNEYALSLVLRNNRTSPEHPLGVFHPHADLHHVKKENIGLIEVMGLFILPGRLLGELNALTPYLTGEKDAGVVPEADSPIRKHYEWIRAIAQDAAHPLHPETARERIRKALALKCTRVLEDAGVFKQSERGKEGMMRFLGALGYRAL